MRKLNSSKQELQAQLKLEFENKVHNNSEVEKHLFIENNLKAEIKDLKIKLNTKRDHKQVTEEIEKVQVMAKHPPAIASQTSCL